MYEEISQSIYEINIQLRFHIFKEIYIFEFLSIIEKVIIVDQTQRYENLIIRGHYNAISIFQMHRAHPCYSRDNRTERIGKILGRPEH